MDIFLKQEYIINYERSKFYESRKNRVILIIAIIFFFVVKNINNPNKLIGLWDVDGNTKYQFDDDGHGRIIVPNSEYEFTYQIKKNILSIDFINENSTDTSYEFKVSEDELELKDVNEANIILKLKKVKE